VGLYSQTGFVLPARQYISIDVSVTFGDENGAAVTERPKELEKTTPNSARNVCDLSWFLIKFLTISDDLLHQLLV